MAHFIGYPLSDKHNNLKKFKNVQPDIRGLSVSQIIILKTRMNRNNPKEMNFACEQSVARNPFYIDTILLLH